MVVPAPPHGGMDPGFHPQATRRDAFFPTTWIPDETFFQTLVRHVVPEAEIETRTLTFLMFTDYGMPVTFYNDHYDLLLSARISSLPARSAPRRLNSRKGLVRALCR